MTAETNTAPAPALRPGATILGISAVLLPFGADGAVDWSGLRVAAPPDRRRRSRPRGEHGHRLRPTPRRRHT